MSERRFFLKKSGFSVNSFILIMAGIIFFVNPMISLLDILPDFIGCALIMFAANRLRALTGEMDGVFSAFKYMLIVSVARLALLFIMPVTDDVMMLTLTLVFAIIEFGVAMMAFPALFEALSTISLRLGNRVNVRPELRQVSIAFFAARGFSSILPHITSVFSESDDILAPQPEFTMDYSSMLMLANILITLIFAAFFVVFTLPVIFRFASDKELSAIISSEISERKISDPEFFLRRTFYIAFTVAAYCHIFLTDLIGDGINYIPDFIFGAMLVWALALLTKYVKNNRAAIVCASVYTVLAVVNFFFYNDFMKERFFASFDILIFRFPGEYAAAVAVSALESVSLVVTALVLHGLIGRIISDYLDYDVPECFVRTRQIKEKYMRNTRILLKFYTLLLIGTGLSGSAFTALLHLFPYYWMIHFVFNIALFAVASTLFLRLRSGIMTKYERPEDVV